MKQTPQRSEQFQTQKVLFFPLFFFSPHKAIKRVVQKLADPFAFRVANENYLMKNIIYLFHLDLDLMIFFLPCNIGYNVNINPALSDQLGVRRNLKAQMSNCEIYIYLFIFIQLSDIQFI